MLPPGHTDRPAVPSDLRAVADLLIAIDVAEIGEPDWSEQDQADEWADPALNLECDTRVVLAGDGRVVGYGYVRERVVGADFDSDTFVHPDSDQATVEGHLMAFTERRARELVDGGAARPRLTTATHATNTMRSDRIRAAGFTPLRHFYRMTVDVGDAPAVTELPADVVVRAAVMPDDLPAVHHVLTEAFLGHFRSVPQSFEEWVARHPRHADDPAPWLVADVAGEPAGALVSTASVPGFGWVRALGVLEHARGLGVGSGLLHRAFTDFAAAGIPRVSLGVDAANATGALALYERAGMTLERRYDLYEKVLA